MVSSDNDQKYTFIIIDKAELGSLITASGSFKYYILLYNDSRRNLSDQVEH